MEGPKKQKRDLEYSEYDESTAEIDRNAVETREGILRTKERIDQIRKEIEKIKNDPNYDESERAQAIDVYNRIIEQEKEIIQLSRHNIGYGVVLKGLNEMLKEGADKILKSREGDASGTNIEGGDKPRRKPN